ncbi:MAG: hypothetical protein RMJ52_08465 [Gemmataceae bacterium]|nr:hypothetical protein [Gemmataceae bacterium]
MKMKDFITRIIALPLLFVASAPAVHAQAVDPLSLGTLLYNSDGNQLFVGENPFPGEKRYQARQVVRPKPMGVDQFLAQVDELAGTQVKTFLVNPVNNQVLLYKSKIERRFGDGATEDEIKAASPSAQNLVRNLRHFDELGVDPFELLVKRIRAKGMRPMATFRIQSAHVPGSEADKKLCNSPWLAEHPELLLKTKGGAGGDRNSLLDFAHREVRDRKLAILREFMTKYDFEGLQLDFQRFPAFVSQPTPENVKIMSGFVKDVRAMLDDVAKRTGRPRLVLGVRVQETPARCAELALDPVGWCNDGMVDFMVLSKFLFNDNSKLGVPHLDLDLDAFREKLKRKVPIYAAILHLESKGRALSPDGYRSLAAKLWKQGFDGIELFNFFMLRAGEKEELPLFLLKEIGDPKTIQPVGSGK